jgi:hypothetical protein
MTYSRLHPVAMLPTPIHVIVVTQFVIVVTQFNDASVDADARRRGAEFRKPFSLPAT